MDKRTPNVIPPDGTVIGIDFGEPANKKPFNWAVDLYADEFADLRAEIAKLQAEGHLAYGSDWISGTFFELKTDVGRAFWEREIHAREPVFLKRWKDNQHRLLVSRLAHTLGQERLCGADRHNLAGYAAELARFREPTATDVFGTGAFFSDLRRGGLLEELPSDGFEGVPAGMLVHRTTAEGEEWLARIRARLAAG